VVVSRRQHREFECEGEPESNGKVSYYRKLAEETEDDGTPYREAHLWCRSPDRDRKETGILERFRRRFEDGLAAIGEQLEKPRANRRPAVIKRRIGCLQKANARIARHFRIEVDTGTDGRRVQGIRWYYEPVEGTMAMHPGVYCLHSNITDWDADRMWRTYMTLTEVEAVFRCLKSELGLRPDRRTLHLRKTAAPDAEAAALYEAMGIPAPPRKLRKTTL